MESKVQNSVGEQDDNAAWWHTLGVLYRWKRFIFLTSVLVATASVVISLMLPNWYRASSRLLLPQGSGGGLASAMLGNISSAAASLLGGGGGDYVRYIAILRSNRVLEAAVDTFDLVVAYELEEEEFPRESAVSALADNVDVAIDDEYEFLAVSVLDQNPNRAAAITNFLVRALERVEAELSTRTAGQYREYVENRYDESHRTRNIVLDSLESFQNRYGVISLEAQTEAYFSQMAELNGLVVQAEIQHVTLRSQFGENNPQVQSAKRVLDAAEDVFRKSLEGNMRVFPVSEAETPAMIRSYMSLVMEQTIQEKILEFVAPMLEQARFQEQKQIEALQVVDPATAPIKKYKPRRAIIVIAATLSSFILAVVFALTMNWWQVNHSYFYRRLDDAAKGASSTRI